MVGSTRAGTRLYAEDFRSTYGTTKLGVGLAGPNYERRKALARVLVFSTLSAPRPRRMVPTFAEIITKAPSTRTQTAPESRANVKESSP